MLFSELLSDPSGLHRISGRRAGGGGAGRYVL